MKKKWFETWFDSPYYHILYKSRNIEEAALFIPRLLKRLDLDNSSEILDLACGKGRHAYVMSQHVQSVVGIDLSENSILAAKTKFKSIPNLTFERDDMRSYSSAKPFDAIFNLFTSFGYFDSFEDNCLVLRNASSLLKPDGLLLIDFLNAAKIKKELKSEDHKQIDGHSFEIRKMLKDDIIYKSIIVNNDASLHFCEQVQCISLDMFQDMLKKSGLKIRSTFGNYALDPFDADKSDRLILDCVLQ